MQNLSTLFGDKVLTFVLAAVAFLVAAGLILLIFRLAFGNRLRMSGGRGRQQRLGIVDAFDIDRQRQLVIVRRDNIEHLIMIGGPNDVVIESTINRAEIRERADGRGAREPGNLPRPSADMLGDETDDFAPEPMPVAVPAPAPVSPPARTVAPKAPEFTKAPELAKPVEKPRAPVNMPISVPVPVPEMHKDVPPIIAELPPVAPPAPPAPARSAIPPFFRRSAPTPAPPPPAVDPASVETDFAAPVIPPVDALPPPIVPPVVAASPKAAPRPPVFPPLPPLPPRKTEAPKADLVKPDLPRFEPTPKSETPKLDGIKFDAPPVPARPKMPPPVVSAPAQTSAPQESAPQVSAPAELSFEDSMEEEMARLLGRPSPKG